MAICFWIDTLLEITKVQILKVIHNTIVQEQISIGVVGNHKGTNFESNSQPKCRLQNPILSCWKSQRYKF